MGKEVTCDDSKTAGFISAEEVKNMKAGVCLLYTSLHGRYVLPQGDPTGRCSCRPYRQW